MERNRIGTLQRISKRGVRPFVCVCLALTWSCVQNAEDLEQVADYVLLESANETCPCGVHDPDGLAPVVSDDFDRPDSTDVGPTTIGGLDWLEANDPATEYIRILSNRLRMGYFLPGVSGSSVPAQWLNLRRFAADDLVVEVTLSEVGAATAERRMGLTYRNEFQDGYDGPTNPGRGYRVEVSVYNNRIELYAGRKLVASVQPASLLTDTTTLRVFANGDQHCIFVFDEAAPGGADFVPLIDVRDGTYRAGHVGLFGYYSTFNVDDFSIREVPAGNSDPAAELDALDDFDREDALVLGTTPHGALGWEEPNAASAHMQVVGGRAYSHYFLDGSAPAQFANLQSFQSKDVDLTVEMEGHSAAYMTGGRVFGPSWRLADVDGDFNDPGYHLRVDADGLALYAGTQLIASENRPVDLDSHVYRVISVGATHRIYMDGELVIDVVDDSYLDAGYVGVSGWYSIFYFDNFAARDLTVAETFPAPGTWVHWDSVRFQGIGDDFERGDSNELGSAPGGAYPWVEAGLPNSPHMRVMGGTLHTHYFADGTSLPNQWANVANATLENVELEVRARGLSGYMDDPRTFGFSYRLTDVIGDYDDAGYHVRVSETGVRLYAAGTLIGQWLGAVDTEWHDYRVRAVGDRHQVYLDGEEIIDVTDFSYPGAGYVGVFGWYSVAWMDGFYARGVPESGADIRDQEFDIGLYSVGERRGAEVASDGFRSAHAYWRLDPDWESNAEHWQAVMGATPIRVRAQISNFWTLCEDTCEDLCEESCPSCEDCTDCAACTEYTQCISECPPATTAADGMARITSLLPYDNISSWVMPEEIRHWRTAELTELQNLHQWTRTHDPMQRPTSMYLPVGFEQNDLTEYIPTLDIFESGARIEGGRPRSFIRYKAEQVVTAIETHQSITGGSHYVGPAYTGLARIPVLVLPSGTEWSYSDAETYHDALLAIASGAMGVRVWSHQNGLADGVDGLGGYEAAARVVSQGEYPLSPALLRGASYDGLQVNITSGLATTENLHVMEDGASQTINYPSVSTLTKLIDGVRYIIAVHSGSDTVDVEFSGAGRSGDVQVLHEDRLVTMSNGVFTDSFGPWEVHIYRYATVQTDVPAPAQVTDCASTGRVEAEAPHDVITPPALTDPGVCEAVNTLDLLGMITDPACEAIVLTSPEYDTPPPPHFPYLRVQRPVDIWGYGVSQTHLHFGVEFRPDVGVVGASNSSLRGVLIEVNDGTAVQGIPGQYLDTAAVVFWEGASSAAGNLEGIVLEDVLIKGGQKIHAGVFGTAPRGARLARIQVEAVQQFGVNIRNNRYERVTLAERPELYDIRVFGVSDPVCLTSETDDDIRHPSCPFPGTNQIGIWVGASHAVLQGAHVRDVFWAGIGTGRVIGGEIQSPSGEMLGVTDALVTDLDVDRIGLQDDGAIPGRAAGTGIYIESVLRDSTISRFCVGPETERGVNVEWNKNELGSGNFEVSSGWVESTFLGVGFDGGTYDAHVENVAVSQAQWAAFLFHKNWEGYCHGEASQPNTTTWSQISAGPGVSVCAPGASYDANVPCTCLLSFSHFNPAEARFCEFP